jgi:hypothetical protein
VVFRNPLRVQIKQRGAEPAAIQDAVTTAFDREFGRPTKLQLQSIFFEARKPE